ncbi:MAG TPA: type IV pilin protein [Burkholderiales bacterium]|jgi:type IV pilus assembly protein PilE|nr:type IV pilin protein [Burkholderiales bacterium]
MRTRSNRFCKASRDRGFTLIEVMIAVGIVAILAAIALPSYQQYVARGKLAEATAALAGQRVKMEQYYQDNRTYTGACAAGTVAPLPTGEHFDYACNIPVGGQSYTITATAKVNSGVDGFQFSIDQSNTRRTVAVPAGWQLPAGNCWVQRKNGTC